MITKAMITDGRDCILAGFSLVRPFVAPASFDPMLEGRTLCTLSSCLSEIIPDPTLLSWEKDATRRAKLLSTTNLSEKAGTALAQECRKLFDRGGLGWASTIHNLEDAQQIFTCFFSGLSGWRVFGFGVPIAYVESVIEESSGSAGNGNPSPLVLEHRAPMPAKGRLLGYDILNIEHGGEFSHSFLCNNLQKDARDTFGIVLNDNGLISDVAKASVLAAHFHKNNLGEPGPWFPVFIADYTAS